MTNIIMTSQNNAAAAQRGLANAADGCQPAALNPTDDRSTITALQNMNDTYALSQDILGRYNTSMNILSLDVSLVNWEISDLDQHIIGD